jgi:heme/copper-type cytochrome/quinol oxidase subunit 2
MPKFTSINSFLIFIYFFLFDLATNNKIKIFWRIIIAIFLTLMLFPSVSIVYCVDNVITDPQFSLGSETVGPELVPKEENAPTVIHHIIAISIPVVIALLIIWRFSKGDHSVVNNSGPTLLIRNE